MVARILSIFFLLWVLNPVPGFAQDEYPEDNYSDVPDVTEELTGEAAVDSSGKAIIKPETQKGRGVPSMNDPSANATPGESINEQSEGGNVEINPEEIEKAAKKKKIRPSRTKSDEIAESDETVESSQSNVPAGPKGQAPQSQENDSIKVFIPILKPKSDFTKTQLEQESERRKKSDPQPSEDSPAQMGAETGGSGLAPNAGIEEVPSDATESATSVEFESDLPEGLIRPEMPEAESAGDPDSLIPEMKNLSKLKIQNDFSYGQSLEQVKELKLCVHKENKFIKKGGSFKHYCDNYSLYGRPRTLVMSFVQDQLSHIKIYLLKNSTELEKVRKSLTEDFGEPLKQEEYALEGSGRSEVLSWNKDEVRMLVWRKNLKISSIELVFNLREKLSEEQILKSSGERFAKKWLDKLDAGDYISAWSMSTDSFKTTGSQVRWSVSIDKDRKVLGALRERVLSPEQSQADSGQGEDKKFYRFDFFSTFQNLDESVKETVVVRDNGQGVWATEAYYLVFPEPGDKVDSGVKEGASETELSSEPTSEGIFPTADVPSDESGKAGAVNSGALNDVDPEVLLGAEQRAGGGTGSASQNDASLQRAEPEDSGPAGPGDSTEGSEDSAEGGLLDAIDRIEGPSKK